MAKFSEYKDRETVRKSAYTYLKKTKFYINEQFPKEIENRRKQLYPVRREAAKSGDKVRLVVDKLYICDTLYEIGKPVPRSKSKILSRSHTAEELKTTSTTSGTPMVE